MVYQMCMRIDGGCRHNGYANAIGAAAVFREYRSGKGRVFKYHLDHYPRPTSQSKSSAASDLLNNFVNRTKFQERNCMPSSLP